MIIIMIQTLLLLILLIMKVIIVIPLLLLLLIIIIIKIMTMIIIMMMMMMTMMMMMMMMMMTILHIIQLITYFKRAPPREVLNLPVIGRGDELLSSNWASHHGAPPMLHIPILISYIIYCIRL